MEQNKTLSGLSLNGREGAASRQRLLRLPTQIDFNTNEWVSENKARTKRGKSPKQSLRLEEKQQYTVICCHCWCQYHTSQAWGRRQQRQAKWNWFVSTNTMEKTDWFENTDIYIMTFLITHHLFIPFKAVPKKCKHSPCYSHLFFLNM